MAFSRLSLDELTPGLLAKIFQEGQVAAIIECGDKIAQLWSMLLLDSNEKMPWELPLSDLARNHWAGKDLTTTVGDVFYFQPGQHSYIARKLEIERCNGAAPQVRPDQFEQPGGTFRPAGEMVRLSCWLVDQLMRALVPATNRIPDYRVAVQRLRYQSDWGDFEKLCRLVSNSLGRWGRTGYALDVSRQQPARMFAGKGISDLLGLLMMAPVIGPLLRAANQKMVERDRLRRIASGEQVYERAHQDHRFFSALCGSRENIRTEVLYRNDWIPLPVNLTSLAVFPGTLMQPAGLKPTIHRVVYQDTESRPAQSPNITILLGAT